MLIAFHLFLFMCAFGDLPPAKTRLQEQVKTANQTVGKGGPYSGIFNCLRKMLVHEGLSLSTYLSLSLSLSLSLYLYVSIYLSLALSVSLSLSISLYLSLYLSLALSVSLSVSLSLSISLSIYLSLSSPYCASPSSL